MNLQPVIDWLENGCDPMKAAEELRVYQATMDVEKAVHDIEWRRTMGEIAQVARRLRDLLDKYDRQMIEATRDEK